MELKLDKFLLSISESERQIRRLSDMKKFFADRPAVEKLLKNNDPIIYEVYACEIGDTGDLSYAITIINPGDINGEYFMTKGHFHDKEVAEVYIGLEGSGVLLMQDRRGKTKKLMIKPGKVSYVPRGFAHRAANTGKKQLKFLAIYPSDSGHDYDTIEKEGFKEIIKRQRHNANMMCHA